MTSAITDNGKNGELVRKAPPSRLFAGRARKGRAITIGYYSLWPLGVRQSINIYVCIVYDMMGVCVCGIFFTELWLFFLHPFRFDDRFARTCWLGARSLRRERLFNPSFSRGAAENIVPLLGTPRKKKTSVSVNISYKKVPDYGFCRRTLLRAREACFTGMLVRLRWEGEE